VCPPWWSIAEASSSHWQKEDNGPTRAMTGISKAEERLTSLELMMKSHLAVAVVVGGGGGGARCRPRKRKSLYSSV